MDRIRRILQRVTNNNNIVFSSSDNLLFYISYTRYNFSFLNIAHVRENRQ